MAWMKLVTISPGPIPHRARSASAQAQDAARARTPIGAATVKPARWRSSSDSPPHIPYSRLARANCRHCGCTGHVPQRRRAWASRRTLACGRSARGGKKRWV